MIVAIDHNQKKARLPNFLGAVSLASLTSELMPKTQPETCPKPRKKGRKKGRKNDQNKKIAFLVFFFRKPLRLRHLRKRKKRLTRARIYTNHFYVLTNIAFVTRARARGQADFDAGFRAD